MNSFSSSSPSSSNELSAKELSTWGDSFFLRIVWILRGDDISLSFKYLPSYLYALPDHITCIIFEMALVGLGLGREICRLTNSEVKFFSLFLDTCIWGCCSSWRFSIENFIYDCLIKTTGLDSFFSGTCFGASSFSVISFFSDYFLIWCCWNFEGSGRTAIFEDSPTFEAKECLAELVHIFLDMFVV